MSAFLFACRNGTGVGYRTEVHNMIAANGAVIDNNIPCPKGDGIPLIDRVSEWCSLGCVVSKMAVLWRRTFFTSNFFLPSTAFPLPPSAARGASLISTSAMSTMSLIQRIDVRRCGCGCGCGCSVVGVWMDSRRFPACNSRVRATLE